MRIAILGSGSLPWEGGLDFDRWHGPWEYDGPILKLEFSRVSEKRLKETLNKFSDIHRC